MQMRISITDVSLQYSTGFLDKVESVINMNVDKDVSLVALFIFNTSWGKYSYCIEDIR